MKLAMEQSARVAAESGPLPRRGQTLAAGLEDEAMPIPLAVEKISGRLDALEWLLTIETPFPSQVLDLQKVKKIPIPTESYKVARTCLTPLRQNVPLSRPLGKSHQGLCHSDFFTALIDQYPLSLSIPNSVSPGTLKIRAPR